MGCKKEILYGHGTSMHGSIYGDKRVHPRRRRPCPSSNRSSIANLSLPHTPCIYAAPFISAAYSSYLASSASDSSKTLLSFLPLLASSCGTMMRLLFSPASDTHVHTFQPGPRAKIESKAVCTNVVQRSFASRLYSASPLPATASGFQTQAPTAGPLVCLVQCPAAS